jgi:histidine ammonia-lyase
VGLLADVRIPAGDLELLQRNVIRSHCAGVGDPLAREVVRAMMLIRANVLAKGFSGIRPLVAERICALVNRGVTPVVPSQGSVGASGDLAPLAHMAMVLIGEGEAEFEGAIMPGADALRRAGIEPLTLAAKEGISLINGTQAMLAIGCLEVEAAQVLTEPADVVCAMTLDALRGTPRAFDERIHAARPHPGQWKARRDCAACWKEAKSANRTSLAGACRTLIRCAARRRCMGRCATRWRRLPRCSPSS